MHFELRARFPRVFPAASLKRGCCRAFVAIFNAPGSFPRVFPAASLKRQEPRRLPCSWRIEFSAGIPRGLIEAQRVAQTDHRRWRVRSFPRVFPAASLKLALIVQGPVEPCLSKFSAGIPRGLIEATWT